MLLTWTRRRPFGMGFGPIPIVFSTNLFLWFRDDWFALQFLLEGLVTTFAGNFSLLGSVANVIVFEQARDEAPVGFWEYARIGIPTTLVATAVSVSAFLAMH